MSHEKFSAIPTPPPATEAAHKPSQGHSQAFSQISEGNDNLPVAEVAYRNLLFTRRVLAELVADVVAGRLPVGALAGMSAKERAQTMQFGLVVTMGGDV